MCYGPNIGEEKLITVRIIISIIIAFSWIFFPAKASAQRVAVKSNLLYDATSTVNIGVEIALSRKVTIDIPLNYNPWGFSDNKKMKHFMIQPEIRLWSCEKFNGNFWGIHTHYGYYNMGGMLPFGFKDGKFFGIENRTIKKYRFQGYLLGAGISFGHQWMITNKWSAEFEVGVGYTYLNYKKYFSQKCGDMISNESKNYLGPTKVALSIIYNIK